jgi:hypothetical protein
VDAAVVTGVLEVVTVVCVVVLIGVDVAGAVDVVPVLQDARTKDATSRQATTIQIVFLFI